MSNEKIQRKLTFLATTFDVLRWYAENARIYRGSVPHRGRFLDALCGLDAWGKGIVLDLVQRRISFESHQVVRRKVSLHPIASAPVGVLVLGAWPIASDGSRYFEAGHIAEDSTWVTFHGQECQGDDRPIGYIDLPVVEEK